MDTSAYYTAAVTVASAAAIFSFLSARNSSKSATAAMLGLTRKYEMIVEHKVDPGLSYNTSAQAFLVDVSFFNIGEVPVFLEAWLAGDIDCGGNGQLNFSILTPAKFSIIKPGEHQTMTFQMLTSNMRGTARIVLNYEKQNSRREPVTVKHPVSHFPV
ncbi:hypothetical protein [Pseudomonas atacamensis]|uniref:hypothetical protein n=1 Tax=Pseudomonas atacamensis TaxID=2565368 RepID=UPI0019D22DC0|nr:hypothetical protein [Pseudomonas atacamensis]QSL85466.1 hypothetical protein JWU58_14760 [Pseudomonas atacamensis]